VTVGSTLGVSGTTTLGTALANRVVITGAAAAGSPSITAAGSDTNINLTLDGKGTGGVILGSGSAVTLLEIGTCTNTGTATSFACTGGALSGITNIAAGDIITISQASGTGKVCSVSLVTTNSFTVLCSANLTNPVVWNVLHVKK
jgi:hypothetical protein